MEWERLQPNSSEKYRTPIGVTPKFFIMEENSFGMFIFVMKMETIMETVIRIRTNELTPDFLNKIKALFNKDEELEISISPVSDFGLNKKESREEYVSRINKAIRNLDKQTSNVSLSDSDFENLTNDLLASK